MTGLPGSGKTTLAQQLASDLRAVYLRIDTLGQALRDLCDLQVEGEGYGLAYRIAADNLRLGMSVVADSCNPIELTRREWEGVAEATGAEFINVEVTCSDSVEDRHRLESRTSSVPSLSTATWADVVAREYHPWTVPTVKIDTAGCSPETSYKQLRILLDGG